MFSVTEIRQRKQVRTGRRSRILNILKFIRDFGATGDTVAEIEPGCDESMNEPLPQQMKVWYRIWLGALRESRPVIKLY